MARLLTAGAFLLAGVHADQSAAPDAAQVVSALNDAFLSPAPSSGVVMRQALTWENWCGQGCYNGYADCKISACFWNYGIAVNKDHDFYGEVQLTFGQGLQVGIVFNATLVQRELASCYFPWDGNTWYRYNRGCGCWADFKDMKCSSPHSPFSNLNNESQWIAGDDPLAAGCECNAADVLRYPGRPQCFWRGPAYNTGKDSYWGKSQFEQFYENKKKWMLKPKGTYSWEGPQNWDEVVLSVPRLRAAMEADPAQVVTAVFVFSDSGTEVVAKSYQQAVSLVNDVKAAHGIAPPIVGFRVKDLTPSVGPFFDPKAAVQDAARLGPAGENVVV